MHSVKKCVASFIRNGYPLILTHHSKHSLPGLPFDYNALEPILCKEIMEMHHKKHHQGYVTSLNEIEESLKECGEKIDLKARECLLEQYQKNLGGHINHSLFWANLTPTKTKLDGELLRLVNKSFGSFRCMREQMIETANSVRGAGWVWLGYNRKTCSLEIAVTCNEDRLFYTHCLYPLLGIDVWEHAYYLQYLDCRPDYSRAIFEVINWEEVRQRYLDAKCGIVKLA